MRADAQAVIWESLVHSYVKFEPNYYYGMRLSEPLRAELKSYQNETPLLWCPSEKKVPIIVEWEFADMDDLIYKHHHQCKQQHTWHCVRLSCTSTPCSACESNAYCDMSLFSYSENIDCSYW